MRRVRYITVTSLEEIGMRVLGLKDGQRLVWCGERGSVGDEVLDGMERIGIIVRERLPKGVWYEKTGRMRGSVD